MAVLEPTIDRRSAWRVYPCRPWPRRWSPSPTAIAAWGKDYNVAIGLLRLLGAPNIAAATRRYAARPALALRAVGLPSDSGETLGVVCCLSRNRGGDESDR